MYYILQHFVSVTFVPFGCDTLIAIRQEMQRYLGQLGFGSTCSQTNKTGGLVEGWMAPWPVVGGEGMLLEGL